MTSTPRLRDPGPRLRVCIVGCGAVTQAIHLPVLASLPELFDVSVVVDADADLAQVVADRVGARSASSLDEALAQHGFDVVAICSPAQFHAQHVIEACAAGVRAVLCEKPLALSLDDAYAIGDAAEATGVPVLVATMHAFDPAFARARKAWRRAGTVSYVESVCFLPPNDRFVESATQPARASSAPAPADPPHPATAAIFGLASHHIPLVRDLLGGIVDVVAARSIAPFGYDVTLAAHGAVGRMVGLMTDAAEPEWSVRAVAADAYLTARFPPSYVQAGSATATVQKAGSLRQWAFDESGYVREWRALARAAHAGEVPTGSLTRAIDDLAAAALIVDVIGARGGASV